MIFSSVHRWRRLLPVLLFAVAVCARAVDAPTSAVAHGYDVRDFGATGDGKTLDTEAINKTIEAASAAGGGTVRFPAGTYLSFTIRLKSNITLELEAGCTLLAASPAEAKGVYDAAEPNDWDQYQDFGHSHWQNSLITGTGLENISILGPGLINGKGLVRFGPPARPIGRAGEAPSVTPAANGPNPIVSPTEPPPAAASAATATVSAAATASPRTGGRFNMTGQGNKAIGLKLCRNVVLRDFSVLQGGHFALLATGVDNLTIDNLKIDTNRDGFDLDACRNVRLANCTVNSPNDDGICLKSSSALGPGRACENITITNCQVSGYDLGSLLDGTFKRTMEKAPDRDGPTGRIKLGTESSGSFRNITISNCVFDRSRGFAIESVDGSVIEDVTVTNITMRDVSSSPLFLRIGSRLRGPNNPAVGTIRRVIITNITASDVDPRYPIIIAGIPGHPVEDLQLSNIRIVYKGGLAMADAAQQPLALVNTFFQRMTSRSPDAPPTAAPAAASPREPFSIPEWEAGYPEPSIFGVLPAYGLFIRHARNVALRDVELSFAKDDGRAAIVLMDVAGVGFAHTTAWHMAGTHIFALRNVSDFESHQVSGLPDAQRAHVEQEDL